MTWCMLEECKLILTECISDASSVLPASANAPAPESGGSVPASVGPSLVWARGLWSLDCLAVASWVWADSPGPVVLGSASPVKRHASYLKPIFDLRLCALPVVFLSLQMLLQTQILDWTCSDLFPPHSVRFVQITVTLFPSLPGRPSVWNLRSGQPSSWARLHVCWEYGIAPVWFSAWNIDGLQ